MKIALVVSSLQCGGAERVAVQMASWWARCGHEVTLVTYETAASAFYAPDARVQHREIPDAEVFSVPGKIWRLLRRVYRLRRVLSKIHPEKVISHGEFMSVLSFCALFPSVRRQIAMEHTVSQDQTVSAGLRKVKNQVYRYLSTTVVLNDAIRHELGNIPHVVVIPNAVAQPSIEPGPLLERPKRIIAMGRLTRQKGFDLLLSAWSRIAARYPDWQLEIWGEGTEEQSLRRQAQHAGISSQVLLRGLTHTPDRELASAQIFILSSRWESFGNVIVEAMACATPVISFDCPSGPRTILSHHHTGVLVPPEDIEELSAAIAALIDNPQQRQKLASAAKDAAQAYSEKNVMQKWDAVLGL